MNILKVFKVISRKNSLRILMMLKESCATISEISSELSIERSKVEREIRKLEKMGLLKRIGKKEGEDLYDLASADVYELLESGERIAPKKIYEGVKGEKIVDLRGEICPVPTMTTKRVFEKANKGELIEIWVDYPLAKERIVSKYSDFILGVEDRGDFWRIILKK